MAGTTDPGSPQGAARSLEVELKFDVDDQTILPDWTRLPGVARVADAEPRELDAWYFDTDDLTLAKAGYALRRRTGGPDEGWHLKGPRVGDARVELQWPLGDTGEVPQQVWAAVSSLTDAAALTPLARIRNARTAYALCDNVGGVVAEFVDDRVQALDGRAGVERSWREWEFELGPAAPTDRQTRAALFAAAEAAVAAVGGRAAASASKLARTLGA